MDETIKKIQEEINQLMSSKFAKLSDKQLEHFSKMEQSFEDIQKLHSLHINDGLTITQIAEKHSTSNAEVRKKFDRWSLPYQRDVRYSNRFKKIEKYSLSGEYLETFDSIKDAAKSVNRSLSSLKNAIQGGSKTCGGFIWKFKN